MSRCHVPDDSRLFWLRSETEIASFQGLDRLATVLLLWSLMRRPVVSVLTHPATDEYISASLESVSLLSEIARAVAKLVDARVASFWQADDEARVLTLVASSDPVMDDFPARTLPYDQDVLGRVATGHRRSACPTSPRRE